jgi:hypothetical protein
VAEHELDVEQTGQLQIGREPDGARHLLATFEPPIALADHSHHPIIA